MIFLGDQRPHCRLFTGSASWTVSWRSDAYAQQGRRAQAGLHESRKTTRDFGPRTSLGDAIAPTAWFGSNAGRNDASEIIIFAKKNLPGRIRRSVADAVAKIKRELHWKPAVTF